MEDYIKQMIEMRESLFKEKYKYFNTTREKQNIKIYELASELIEMYKEFKLFDFQFIEPDTYINLKVYFKGKQLISVINNMGSYISDPDNFEVWFYGDGDPKSDVTDKEIKSFLNEFYLIEQGL